MRINRTHMFFGVFVFLFLLGVGEQAIGDDRWSPPVEVEDARPTGAVLEVTVAQIKAEPTKYISKQVRVRGTVAFYLPPVDEDNLNYFMLQDVVGGDQIKCSTSQKLPRIGREYSILGIIAVDTSGFNELVLHGTGIPNGLPLWFWLLLAILLAAAIALVILAVYHSTKGKTEAVLGGPAEMTSDELHVDPNPTQGASKIPGRLEFVEGRQGVKSPLLGIDDGTQTILLLGREDPSTPSPANFISVADVENTSVSRKHGELHYADGVLKYKHLSTQAHSYVNDAQIGLNEVTVIKDGDLIRMGIDVAVRYRQ